MDERYINPEIRQIWGNEHKLALWQDTELAVMGAMFRSGEMSQENYNRAYMILRNAPIDIDWWKQKDNEIHHDLNAFIEERRRHLPPEIGIYLHRKITSYDTEEPAFAVMIKESLEVVIKKYDILLRAIVGQASKYRYTIMNGRTHGQEAELQTFGKRCLTWIAELNVCRDNLQKTMEGLQYSKLSGAVGNYGKSLNPELEKEALRILCFEPFYGSTQIMPRVIYAPIAEALCQLVYALNNIALAIRLGARSGNPIFQEPFGKKQTGSSTMPQKKNTILTEQIEGMSRMAKGYFNMILENIKTWEERAIEQSCVERVAWPDLFHVTVRALTVMDKVISGLRVYPDHMLLEIINSRGCYAASEAKEFLKKYGVHFDLSAEDAYRIVQLAAFNVFDPDEEAQRLRDNPARSLIEAEQSFKSFKNAKHEIVSIQEIIKNADLKVSSQLEIKEERIRKWNEILSEIFHNPVNRRLWNEIFRISTLLENENTLYQEILGPDF